MGKKKISKRKMAKIKAIAYIVAAAIGAILVIGAIAYGVSRFISNKAERIVQEKMNAQAQEVEQTAKEPAEEIAEEPEEELVEDYSVKVEPIEDIIAEEPEITEPVEEKTEEPQTEEIVAIDKARIRSTPSTDGEILGTTKIGDKFTRYSQTDGGWSQIMYNDQEAYIKSDYVELYTGQDNTANTAQEEQTEETTETTEASASTDDAAKKAAEEAAKKAAEEAAKAAQEAATQQTPAPAPAAPAPAVGGAHVVTTSDGATMTVNDAQYAVFQKYWGYLGNVDETVSHHTKGDLVTLLQNEGVY